MFDALVNELRGDDCDDVTVLDLCCSYGVNAALLNHQIALAELEQHYAEATALSVEDLLEHDRKWFAERRRPDPVDVIGHDTSGPAVEYATEVGLLACGVVADLETGDISQSDASKLDDVNLGP